MRGLWAFATLSLLLVAGCTSGGPEESAEGGEVPIDGPVTTTPAPSPVVVAPPPTPTLAPLDPGPATPAPVATPPPAAVDPVPTTPPPAAPPPPVTTSPPPPAPPSPTPTPTPSPAAPPKWPREGSFVSYYVETSQSFSGTPQGFRQYVNATWTYRGGDWHGVCAGNRHSTDSEGVVTITPVRATFEASNPPHWPLFDTRTPPAVGEDVATWWLRGCAIESDEWPYRGADSATTTVNGAPTLVPTYRATSDPGELPYDVQTEWSTKTGLVVEWSLARVATQAPFSNSGRLTDTDAPLA